MKCINFLFVNIFPLYHKTLQESLTKSAGFSPLFSQHRCANQPEVLRNTRNPVPNVERTTPQRWMRTMCQTTLSSVCSSNATGPLPCPPVRVRALGRVAVTRTICRPAGRRIWDPSRCRWIWNRYRRCFHFRRAQTGRTSISEFRCVVFAHKT